VVPILQTEKKEETIQEQNELIAQRFTTPISNCMTC